MLSLFLEDRSTGDEFLFCASINFPNFAQWPYIAFITLKRFLEFFNCKKQKQVQNTQYINTLKSHKMCSYKDKSYQGKVMHFKTFIPRRTSQTLSLQHNTEYHGNRYVLAVQYRGFISCVEKRELGNLIFSFGTPTFIKMS